MPAAPPSSASDALVVACYRPTWRAVLATLVAASAVSAPLILLRVVVISDYPMTLPLLIAMLVMLVLLPAGLAALLTFGFRAQLGIDGDALVVRRRDVRITVPLSAIVAVAPWTVPLPTPGASLRLRSGRRFAYRLALRDPSRLVEMLTRAGAAPGTIAADPAFQHAAARAAYAPPRWWHRLLKFPGFALLPTAVLFRAHQWIAYGGTFGEYYSYGATAYALTFLEHWTTVTIYVVLWAATWRMVGEVLAWLATRLWPTAATAVRRLVEAGCGVLYFGGVPVLLALRFGS